MTSAELRSAFLNYFDDRGHQIIPSYSLVPANDPTLLFTNAGMVQFKDVFLGKEHPSNSRAVSSQRCVRAGGKHNDLENVGYTARHHTFFEMLGNFSFGDYFKQEAIYYAWELLTEIYRIPAERLWVTVHEGDSEAARVWLDDVKVDPQRFSRLGEKDNFWSMGNVGPCGPCTEIFYDHGETVPGGPPGSPEADGDRYVEIWNLVFMEFERAPDKTLTPLPRPSVDTGMGLERLAAVMQGVHSNYEIDLFKNLIAAAAELAGTEDLNQNSLRVIADHIRSCAFLVTDTVLPSNEGRGYVLRRIIRRAIRHGYKLGIDDTFFYKLVKPLCEEMGEAFPELLEARSQVEGVLCGEEQRFAETLEHGMKILETCVGSMSGKEIPGNIVFQLYDTHGFPLDLTSDFAREHGLGVDLKGFEREMAEQRRRARQGNRFVASGQVIKSNACTEFTGYETLRQQTTIVELFRSDDSVTELKAGEDGTVILEQTPFYAESGGQIGDRGLISTGSGVFDIIDTQKQRDDLYLHRGTVKQGILEVDQTCQAHVNAERRNATALNHTATHLLHAALRRVLGDNVTQKGSLVERERLRFDFSHSQPVSTKELNQVESLVNSQIRLNTAVCTEITDMDKAKAVGAMALFGEKYGDRVRVLRIGDFSVELCGGTHVSRAGDIGFFKIIAESGVAAGVRRIEAITGQPAIEWIEENDALLGRISDIVKGSRESIEQRIQQMAGRNRLLEKEVDRLKSKLASASGGDLSSRAVDVQGVKVLAAKLDEADPKSLRDTVDQLKNKLGSAVIVLATVHGEKVSLVAGVTKDKTDQLKAGDLVNAVACRVGGKGGGRADMAQAGGNDPSGLESALSAVPEWVRKQLV